MISRHRDSGARRGSKGFTMIEMVATIVIMGIIAIGLVDFIADSANSYVESSTRNQLSSAARIVVDRLSMELRNALPQSVRTSVALSVTDVNGYDGDQCIEFVPIRAATTYVNPAFRPANPQISFNVVDFVPDLDGLGGVYAVIYPVSAAEIYGASFVAPTTEAIAAVSIADANNMDGINELNTASHRFKRRSEVERLFLTDTPVSFCITGSKLYRYSGYGFSGTQLLPRRPNGTCAAASCLPASTPGRVLISDLVNNGAIIADAFVYTAGSRDRNAMIQLNLNFTNDGESILLNQETVQQNTP